LLRKFALLATAVGAVLCTASSAPAANLAPNPGFENACGTATKACSWYEEASSILDIRRDDSIARPGGFASYRVRLVGPFLGAAGKSDCEAPPPTTPGSVYMSFWYRTTDTRVSAIEMYGWFWSNSTCGSSASGSLVRTLAPDADGDWHQVTGTSNALTGESFSLELGFQCSSSCPGAQVNFDDVVYDQAPTAVRVTSFRGLRTPEGVLLRWRTTHESSVLGFNVYRQHAGRFVRLNRALIPSVFGATTGHTYSWLDRADGAGRIAAVMYRIQAVSLSGQRTWVGSTTAR
jgi:hypothetical protein